MADGGSDTARDETNRLLGQLIAGQKTTVREIAGLREDQRHIAQRVDDLRSETTSNFGAVREDNVAYAAKLESHIVESERRHRDHENAVERAHARITRLTGGTQIIGKGPGPDSDTDERGRGRLVTAVIGILTGLGALGSWFAGVFGSNGTSP